MEYRIKRATISLLNTDQSVTVKNSIGGGKVDIEHGVLIITGNITDIELSNGSIYRLMEDGNRGWHFIDSVNGNHSHFGSITWEGDIEESIVYRECLTHLQILMAIMECFYRNDWHDVSHYCYRMIDLLNTEQ